MANITEELLRVSTDVNTAPMEAGNRVIAEMDRRVEELGRQFRETDMDITVYIAKLKQLEQEKRKAAAAVGAMVGGAPGSGAGGINNLNLALNQLSFAFQDFLSVQGSMSQKLISGSNNIAQMAALIGGPAGLAAAVGLAVTAFAAFWPQIQALIQPADDATDSVGKLKHQLDLLTQDTYGVKVDASAVDAAKKALSDLEDAIKRGQESGSLPDATNEGARRAASAIGEFGGATETQTGRDTLRQTIGRLMRQDPEYQKALEEARATRASFEAQKARMDPMGIAFTQGPAEKAAKRLEELNTQVDQGASSLVGRALQGDTSAIRGLSRFLREDAGAFANAGVDVESLRSGLASADPDEVRRERKLKEEAEKAAELTRQRDESIAQAERAKAEQKKAEEQRMAAAERVFGPGGAMEKEAQAKERAEAEARRDAAQLRQRIEQPGIRAGAATIDDAFGDQIRAQMMSFNMNNPNERALLLQRIMEEQKMRGIGGGQKAAEEAFARNLEMVRANQSVMSRSAGAMNAQAGAMEAALGNMNQTARQFERALHRFNEMERRFRSNGVPNFRPGM